MITTIMSFIDQVNAWISLFSILFGLAGIFVVVWGFCISFFNFLKLKMHKSKTEELFMTSMNKIKTVLGAYIVLGLELMVASDIIATLLQPTRDQLIDLAIIVGIRTVISYFVQKDRTS